MGYTHYYEFTKTEFSQDELQAIRQIVKNYSDIIQFEYNTKKPAAVRKNEIRFNGIGDDAHETFMVCPNEDDFCKTNHKPYDMPICECLLVLKHFNPDAKIDSDSFWIDKQTFDSFNADTFTCGDNWDTAINNVKNAFGFEFKFNPVSYLSHGTMYYRVKLVAK